MRRSGSACMGTPSAPRRRAQNATAAADYAQRIRRRAIALGGLLEGEPLRHDEQALKLGLDELANVRLDRAEEEIAGAVAESQRPGAFPSSAARSAGEIA